MGTVESRKNVKSIKSKANWLPPRIKFIEQIFISIYALFKLPFFKENPNGIQQFFKNNYRGKKDEFIFDGSSENLYYDQIAKNISIDIFNNQIVIDLGCGNGSFYFWLKHKSIAIKQYYGIDFAFGNSDLYDNAIINNVSISKYFENPLHVKAVYIFSNSLCYISEETVLFVLSKLKLNDKIIIIEPYPNLFWDSHFNGIKPYYRKEVVVISLLRKNGFTIHSSSVDYVFNIKNIYLSPISYCLYASKTDIVNFCMNNNK